MTTPTGEQPSSRKRVVIVGGGFAGLSCAGKLASNPAVETMLIDKNNYQEFQPLLYQVATGGVYMVDGAQTAH
jgi:NADH:ubiquinone reductase (H+-translocating)